MKSKIALLLSLITFLQIYCLNNLVNDQGFQTLAYGLTQTYIGIESYNYKLLSNSQSGWYSPTSPSIIIRSKTNPSSTVMDTLNNNTQNIICHNFLVTDFGPLFPYQLTYDCMIDQNVNRPLLKVKWNDQQLIYKRINNHYPQTISFTVYMQQNLNKLCFQAWYETETDMIGPLIDNVIVAKQDVRHINFIGKPIKGVINYLELISNQTIIDESQLQIFQNFSTLNISQTYYNLNGIDKNTENNLVFIIQLYQQYSSSLSVPSITLPSHRNQDNQIIIYYVSSQKLPRYIYAIEQTQQIISQTKSIVILLAKIENICYRIIRIIGFSFISLNWIGYYYLGMMLGFLDINLIDGYVRKQMENVMKVTINGLGIRYFMQLSGKTTDTFAEQYINLDQKLPQPHQFSPDYSSFKITSSIYPLLQDNLLISLFNTVKIFLFYHILFKRSKKMRKILYQIKNQKILIQYIIILPLIILVAGNCWRYPSYLSNSFGKINRAIMTIIPILGIALGLKIFLSQWNMMQSKYIRLHKKGRSNNHIEINKNLRKYYRNKIILSLNECMMLIILPVLIGLNLIYTTLSILLLFIIISIFIKLCIIRIRPSFIHFLQFMIKITQLFIPLCYLFPHIISQIQYIQPTLELQIINILRYNSIVLFFIYVAGGVLEIGICLYHFWKGCKLIQFQNCFKKNQLQNKNDMQATGEDNQIKIQQEIQNIISQHAKSQNDSQISGIIIINQLKNKIQKKSHTSKIVSSSGQITNPFSSGNAIQQKPQKLQQQKQLQNSKSRKQTKQYLKPQYKQKKHTKIITMKNIQPLQLQLQSIEKKIRHKSSSQLQKDIELLKQARPTQIKKAREVSGNKQKSLKMISKINTSEFLDLDIKSANVTKYVLQKMPDSSFEKQENFS